MTFSAVSIEFIKLLISPKNTPNEKDKLTAQILIKCDALQYRINDLEKKINVCMNNVRNMIQKGNKNGYQRKKRQNGSYGL